MASWGVIAREGLHAATLRRVAAAAGVTTGSLTHYFSDREALLVEALRAAHFAAGARMLRAAAAAADDRTRLVAVLEEALPLDERRLREWRVWLAFWGEAVGNAPLLAENRRRTDEWHEFVGTMVVPLLPAGRSGAGAAMALVALIDGLGIRLTMGAGGTATSERAAAREAVTLAVGRLASDPAGVSTDEGGAAS